MEPFAGFEMLIAQCLSFIAHCTLHTVSIARCTVSIAAAHNARTPISVMSDGSEGVTLLIVALMVNQREK